MHFTPPKKSRNHPPDVDVTTALVAALRPLVAGIIAELQADATAADAFTSNDLPRELRHLSDGKRAFAGHCRRMHERGLPGVTLLGAGRGRFWSCLRSTWADYLRPKAPAPVLHAVGVDDLAALAIDAAAMRSTRSTRRSA